VKVVCSRTEELLASNPRENSIVTLRSAVTRAGRIVGREALVYLDSGAYAYDTPGLASTAALQSCGPYAIDAIDATVVPVTTNTAPTGSFRAPTGPQMVYANERHVAEVARRVGVSDIELRRRNLMRRGSRGPTGQVLGTTAADECLERVASQLDVWRADDGDGHGYGLAMAWWCTMAGASAASVTAVADGSLVLQTGATEIGTGAVVSGIVRLVANELGVRSEDVRLVSADTDRTPFDLGSEGSRTLYGAGSASLRAAQAVRRILADAVAEHLEADIHDLEFRDRSVGVVGDRTSRVSLEQAVALAQARQGPVVAAGRFEAPPVPHDRESITGAGYTVHNEPTFHCHGAQVALDRETGQLVVKRYVAAHDTGTVVNLAGVRGQVQGGVIQGLGYALFEEMRLDDQGAVANADLHDYRIPTVGDVPDELEIILVDGYPSASGPYGAKGVGEAPILLPAATIAAALRDLVGDEPGVLPLSADRVSEFLTARLPSYGKEIRGA
jgi:CO/xanthine dehydrogenase Mo-binding subunit